ncbi:hypothetical protein HPB50_021987 [Hyalomma asiaticum]|uniref:Uncharacterized protein n=1 Tax=Hyalomma asiaticum TaxID=266040 RepID=A0ACB7S854_HYAAI|nr:hypothetical protein HPB50_021987 [Hyalomma asiaticum]
MNRTDSCLKVCQEYRDLYRTSVKIAHEAAERGSGEIKKRLAEDCRRKSDICGSGISRAPLRGSGRHNRRSNSVEAGTTRRKSSRRRSPHDLGSADLATWLRETRPLQARSSLQRFPFSEPQPPVRLHSRLPKAPHCDVPGEPGALGGGSKASSLPSGRE